MLPGQFSSCVAHAYCFGLSGLELMNPKVNVTVNTGEWLQNEIDYYCVNSIIKMNTNINICLFGHGINFVK